ncbi:MAG: hypothetical protein AB7S78_01255 [Candidatus Omnitrophota bacterium]
MFSAVTILLALLLLEGIGRIFFVTGSSEFNERRILESGLSQRKPEGEFRVFLFGESTMHGSHLYPHSTIDRWIKIYLTNLLGEEAAARVKVINFGRLGVASDWIADTANEMLSFQPDLSVIYSANNDFIIKEYRLGLQTPPPFLQRAVDRYKKICLRSALLSGIKRIAIRVKWARKNKRRQNQPPKEEFVDQWHYSIHKSKVYDVARHLIDPDSDEMRFLENSWTANLRRIIRHHQKQNIPVAFFNGVSKINGYGPFEPQHKPSLTAARSEQWEENEKTAQADFEAGRYNAAAEGFLRAKAIDDQYALTYFRLGELAELQKDYTAAYHYYTLASDLDHYPIRAPGFVNAYYRDLARANDRGVYILDIDSVFKKFSAPGLVGDDLIIDQIHPTMQGQALMALEVVKLIYDRDLFLPKERWQWDRIKPFEELAAQIEMSDDFLVSLYTYSARYVGPYLSIAETMLESALQIKPKCLLARSHLAWIYWMTDREDQARSLYKELQEEFPAEAKLFFEEKPDIAQMVNKSDP